MFDVHAKDGPDDHKGNAHDLDLRRGIVFISVYAIESTSQPCREPHGAGTATRGAARNIGLNLVSPLQSYPPSVHESLDLAARTHPSVAEKDTSGRRIQLVSSSLDTHPWRHARRTAESYRLRLLTSELSQVPPRPYHK